MGSVVISLSKIFLFFTSVFFVYICLCEGVRSLELELQIVVSCSWELRPGPLEEQPVLLTSEPSR